ncbi:MAG: response regulator [Rubrivivax sp.]|jgi:response regulator NasT|nr:response regulator [Rubrivivax sp.]
MGSKAKILVVDDDRLVLATVTHGLAQAGYEVIDADNGDDAILLARQQRPDLALLDIRMEGKTGFDVAAYLRDASRVPFMFLSAFSDADTVAQADALGAVGYLVKPVDVAQLVPEVDAVLERVRRGAGRTAAPTAPAASATPAAPSAPVAAPPVAGDDPVPLAIGVLMHRHSLSRVDAAARLQRMAAEQGLPMASQAERLLAAIEELSRS